MFQHIAAYAILSQIIYFLLLLFFVWMAYRFVKAHESMADSLRRMERRNSGEDPHKTDRYNFGKH